VVVVSLQGMMLLLVAEAAADVESLGANLAAVVEKMGIPRMILLLVVVVVVEKVGILETILVLGAAVDEEDSGKDLAAVVDFPETKLLLVVEKVGLVETPGNKLLVAEVMVGILGTIRPLVVEQDGSDTVLTAVVDFLETIPPPGVEQGEQVVRVEQVEQVEQAVLEEQVVQEGIQETKLLVAAVLVVQAVLEELVVQEERVVQEGTQETKLLVAAVAVEQVVRVVQVEQVGILETILSLAVEVEVLEVVVERILEAMLLLVAVEELVEGGILETTIFLVATMVEYPDTMRVVDHRSKCLMVNKGYHYMRVIPDLTLTMPLEDCYSPLSMKVEAKGFVWNLIRLTV
jgi:hypothetical protein